MKLEQISTGSEKLQHKAVEPFRKFGQGCFFYSHED